MSTEDIIGELRSFLREEMLDSDDGADIDADENIIQGGIIDSTGAVRLAMHVEQTYGIEVTATDFTPDNFRSLSSLASLVLLKRTSS